jgi:hypothetical protein
MMPEPILPEHRVWLATLIEKYGARRLMEHIGKRKVAAPRSAGRPANNQGNLLGVYRYIEFHRKQKTSGGRTLGISGACARLKKQSDAFIVNFKLSEERLRAMYYEAKKTFSTAELEAAVTRHFSDDSLPLFMKKMADGSLGGVIIDRFGRGGR